MLTITKTPFTVEDHECRTRCKDRQKGMDYYVYGATVFNQIVINGEEFEAVYQTGTSYLHGDYNLLSAELELNTNYSDGTSKLLALIDQLRWDEITDKETDISYELEEIAELCPAIKTIDDIIQVKKAIESNLPNFYDHFSIEEYPDEPEDDEDDDDDE